MLDALRAAGVPVAIAMAGGYAETIDDIVDIHFATVTLALDFWRRGAGCAGRLAGREAAGARARRAPARRRARPRGVLDFSRRSPPPHVPMATPLLLERDGAVATLTLNRPDALNTLDFALMDALIDAAADVAADDALRVVVLRGAGKHFMAGGDLRTFAGELAEAGGAARCRLPRA